MKQSYRSRAFQLSAGLIALVSAVSVQGAPPPGHFRFLNAAGLSGKISLTIDTAKVKPEGFAAGDTTGSIGMLAGVHQFTISSSEAGTASASLNLQPSSSTTMIAYCKVAVDPQSNTAKKTLQLLQRPSPPLNNGRHFQLLYVSSQLAADVVVNGTARRIDAMREINGEELPGGEIKVEQGGKVIVAFNAPQAGNFLVLLYDDATGKLAGVVLPDYT